MTDASSLQHPLAVDAVHWSPGGGAHLLVRVEGQWRRRPPASPSSPVLQIDTERGRRRFPALADPASASGPEPGLWVACFVVPASLAPYLAGRLTLILGNVAIALPAAVTDPGEPPAAAGGAALIPAGPEPIVITDMRGRRENAEAPDVEPDAMLEWLDLELTRSREHMHRLRAELALAERGRHRAEQRAQSEVDLRLALAREQADRLDAFAADACSVLALVKAAKGQARALAGELAELRGVTDAAAARPAGRRDVGLEDALLRLAAEGADGEDRLVRDGAADTERDGPPERAAPPEPALEPERLAAALTRLREQNPAGGRRSPPAPPSQAPSRRPWLRRALRRVLDEDPALAGEAVLGLVPALVRAGAVRYDVVLGPADARAVTVSGDGIEIERRSEPRPLEDVSFRIEGDLEGLARLLVYGAVRRRLSRRVARVRGGRRGDVSALRRAVRRPAVLDELAASGARLEPAAALALVAGMIDPEWTVGEVFAIAHETDGPEPRGAYLLVCDGARPRASRGAPPGGPTTTVLAPERELLALLAEKSGAHPTGPAVLGASRPLALVREWIARAQRDS